MCKSANAPHYFAINLPQSNDCFVRAFPAETTEAWFSVGCAQYRNYGPTKAKSSWQSKNCGGHLKKRKFTYANDQLARNVGCSSEEVNFGHELLNVYPLPFIPLGISFLYDCQ